MAERVLIVGDSQAAGPVGSQLARDLQASGVEVHRIAYSGHGAYDWTRLHWAEYLSTLRNFAPAHVIMVFGSNDPANAELEAAMRQFKASAPAVWYAGPPQYATVPDRQARGADIRALANRVFGSRHLDAWPYTGPSALGERNSRTADGIHFTTEGASAWARGIFDTWRWRARALGPVMFVVGLLAAGGVIWLWQRR